MGSHEDQYINMQAITLLKKNRINIAEDYDDINIAIDHFAYLSSNMKIGQYISIIVENSLTNVLTKATVQVIPVAGFYYVDKTQMYNKFQ